MGFFRLEWLFVVWLLKLRSVDGEEAEELVGCMKIVSLNGLESFLKQLRELESDLREYSGFLRTI
jgi:hypothetical protein